MSKRRGYRSWIPFCAVLSLVFFTHSATSEVYRWTDSEGKVHYSDRKLNRDAEDVTDKVRVQNIDTSQEEQRKLQQIFRKENEADREHYRRQEQAKKPSADQRRRCNELRNYLRNIDGRVQFVDNDGKPMKVTERERQQMAQDTRELWNQHCSRL